VLKAGQCTSPDVGLRRAATVAVKDGILVSSENGDLRALFLKDGHIAIEIFPALPSQPVEPPLMAENRPDAVNHPPCPTPLVLGHLTTKLGHRSNQSKRCNRVSRTRSSRE